MKTETMSLSDELRAVSDELGSLRWPVSGALEVNRDRLSRAAAALEERDHALRCIVLNAVLVSDPQMKGTTDTYAVPLDDIEAARAALGA